MPFQSEKQRRYLHANHPEIAKRWERDYANGGITQLVQPGPGRPGYGGPHDSYEAGQSYSSSKTKSSNTGGGDNKEKYIATQYNKPKKKYTPPPGEKGGPGYVEKPKKKTITTKDDKTPLYIKKKKKKTDWVDKTLETVDIADKLYKFGTTLNPLQLYNTNPYILGGTLLKGLYDKKKKKKKSVDDQVSLDVGENIELAKLSTKGLIEYNKLSKKKDAHTATDGLTPPLTDKEEKRLEQLEKEKNTKLETEEVTMIGAKGGIANHFRKKFNTGSEPVIGDALFRGNWNDYSNEQLQMMFPDWDPEIESIDEHIKKKQSMNVDFAAVTEGNGILDLTEGDETTEVASTEENEIIPDLLAPGSASGILAAKGGHVPMLVGKRKDGKRPGYKDDDYDYGGVYSGGASSSNTGGGSGAPGGGDPGMTYTAPYQDRIIELQNREEAKQQKLAEQHANEFEGTGPIQFDPNEFDVNPDSWKYQTDILEFKTKKYILDNLKHLDPEAYYKGMPGWQAAWEKMSSVPTSIPGILIAMYKNHKLTKEGEALLEEWGHFVGGPPGSNPQTYDDLWNALEKRKAKYRDQNVQESDGDGPEVPLAPTIQLLEDEMYASRDGMSAWDIIKANQARKAMLVTKGIHTEDPITDITLRMDANRGGLANLFRVKNQ